LKRLVEERLYIFSSGIELFRQANQTITKRWIRGEKEARLVMDSIRLFIGKMSSEGRKTDE
jgi:hypothetical protein